MKKILFLSLIFIGLSSSLFAVKHTITIIGFAYQPVLLSINLGDTVTIDATSGHPTAQVSAATWYASESTQISEGWGTKTSTFTIVPAQLDTIYYVCTFHVLSSGMKGKIVVNPSTGVTVAVNYSPEISLLPNPINSHGTLTLNTSEPANINVRLFDYYGRFVKTIATDNIINLGEVRYEFDVSDMDSGIYYLMITENNQEFFKKIVVLK
jgi:plastocyanin